MRTLSPTRIATLASVTVVLAACGGSDGETDSAADTLSVGTVGIASDASLRIAEDQGVLDEAGAPSLDIQTLANPPAAIAAVQSGEIDVAYTPSVPFFNALNQGVDLTVVAPADGYPQDAAEHDPVDLDDTAVYVASDSGIESPSDLEGRKVAVPARKAQLEVTISEVIRQDGGDPSTVEWMVLDFASALDELERGRIDAAGLVSPFSMEAGAEGHTLLSSPGVAFFEKGAVGLWVTSSEQVDADPEVYRNFRRAMVEAYDYGNDHVEEAQQIAAEITGVDLATIQEGATPYWPSEVRLEDLRRSNEKMTELGYQESEAPLDENMILGAE